MRGLVGYGESGVNLTWPNGAKLALNFVINYEEGAESSPLLGDKYSEIYGLPFPLRPKEIGQRNHSAESLFEYGSRAGVWRHMRLFDTNQFPVTFFLTGLALDLNPELAEYIKASNHDIAGHGWRWIDYSDLSPKEEKAHIIQCKDTLEKLTQKPVTGWYSGRKSLQTATLLREIGGFLYYSDVYNDDIPYFIDDALYIPYTLECNDFRYTTLPGFVSASDFSRYLKNCFDYLYHEQRFCLMTLGVHPRLSGHPGKAHALCQFIQHVKTFSNLWVASRSDIAKFCHQHKAMLTPQA